MDISLSLITQLGTTTKDNPNTHFGRSHESYTIQRIFKILEFFRKSKIRLRERDEREREREIFNKKLNKNIMATAVAVKTSMLVEEKKSEEESVRFFVLISNQASTFFFIFEPIFHKNRTISI